MPLPPGLRSRGPATVRRTDIARRANDGCGQSSAAARAAKCTIWASGTAMAMQSQPQAPNPVIVSPRCADDAPRAPLQGKNQQDHRRPVGGQRRADPGRGSPTGRRRGNRAQQAGKPQHGRRGDAMPNDGPPPGIVQPHGQQLPLQETEHAFHAARFPIHHHQRRREGNPVSVGPGTAADGCVVAEGIGQALPQIGLPQERRPDGQRSAPADLRTSTSGPRRPRSKGIGPASRPSARPACTSGFPRRLPPADPSAARPIRAARRHAESYRNPARPRSHARHRCATWLAECPPACGCTWQAARSAAARGCCASRIVAPAC